MKENPAINKLVEHFFRHESGKMIAVLTKIFSTANLDLAEDVVQDSVFEAISQWQYIGVPDKPSAWLFRVAKNKALNIINREKYKREYSKEAYHFLQSEWTAEPALNYLFSDPQIHDDQLRMIFTCCHPSITPDSQIALALKTLCGFSIPEIAKAFLTSEENINKRLVRARQKIREYKIPFEVPQGNDLEKRLQTVLDTIYLLFNEGYSASRGNDIVRFEICEEAIRLAEIIITNTAIHTKQNVYALHALMQLNACRFKARQDAHGNILTLEEQNSLLWDYGLMEKGFRSLEKSTTGNQISGFHILAAISAYHCSAVNYKSTNWKAILELYENLLQIDNSPVVLLNRAIALSKVHGAEAAISELKQIEGSPSLKAYHLYYSTLGTFHIELGQFKEASQVLEKAINLARVPAEKTLLQKKLDLCHKKDF
ncbi:MAG TPA: sigma-70 family RNA polymerase sigma factor [Flavisolibacter sp.]|nr:sigma-70 family RNA polymerase sigma factor [Flavisolibacter sp.]